MEIWKDIEGYEGLYEISNLGRVKSLPRNTTKGGIKTVYKSGKSSYYKVLLCKNGKQKQPTIHRLLASAFIPNPDNKPQVDHINGDKTDNRIENLRWVTKSENSRAFNTTYGNYPVRGIHNHEKGKKILVVIGAGKDRKQKTFCYNKIRTQEEAERLAIEQRRKWEKEFGYSS